MSPLRPCFSPTCQNTHRNKKYCSAKCRLEAQRNCLLRNRVLSDQQISEAAQLYTNGLPASEIAKRFGTNPSNIYRFLKKAGIHCKQTFFHHGKPYKIKPRFTQSEIDEIKFLYGFGFSAIHVAKHMGMKDKTAVLRVLDTFGLVRRGFDPAKRLQTIDGHFVRSAAERMIDDWLYNHGIAHIYEPQLTVDPHYHADFFARGYYIELWGGGPNQIAYRRTMTKKLALYEAHQLPLISLTWEQTLKNLDTVLAPLLIPIAPPG